MDDIKKSIDDTIKAKPTAKDFKLIALSNISYTLYMQIIRQKLMNTHEKLMKN